MRTNKVPTRQAYTLPVSCRFGMCIICGVLQTVRVRCLSVTNKHTQSLTNIHTYTQLFTLVQTDITWKFARTFCTLFSVSYGDFYVVWILCLQPRAIMDNGGLQRKMDCAQFLPVSGKSVYSFHIFYTVLFHWRQ